MVPSSDNIVLPDLVFGYSELRRIRRELATVDDFLHQSSIRKGGDSPILPKLTRLMDDLCIENNINLLNAKDRVRLGTGLDHILKNSPVVTMSFATDPSVTFLLKIVAWLRKNIHQTVLLQVGSQPGITAGCVLRTKNKIFDLSLRRDFDTKRDILVRMLEAK